MQILNFRLRLAFTFGILFLGMVLAAVLIINRVVTDNTLKSNGQRLSNISYGVAKAVSSNLEERERDIKFLANASSFKGKDIDLPKLDKRLNDLKKSYPYYAWIGYANAKGIVESAADGLLLGKDVSTRPWFIRGSHEVFIGDLHEAVLLAKLLAKPDQNNPLRFIDFAAPVFDKDERIIGVVATHVNWDWMQNIIDVYLAQSLKGDEISVFVVDHNNNVISPYEEIGLKNLPNHEKRLSYSQSTWADGVEYQYASTSVEAAVANNLGWRIITRQPISFSQHSIRKLSLTIIQIASISLLLLLVLSYWVARQISLPIEWLSKHADLVNSSGDKVDWNLQTNVPELSQLAHSIEAMTTRLFHTQAELAENNNNLERLVLERTSALTIANQELEQKASELDHLARTDQLTKLANRRAINEELLKSWHLFKRNEMSYCVIIMDIDHFKHINDTYGHDVGDQVLKEFADLLRHHSRQVDLAGRFGGEEFLICLPGTDLHGAQVLTEKLRLLIENHPFPHVGRVTFSAGVSNAGKRDSRDTDIVSRADSALYESKRNGRNRVSVAPAPIA